ncbi:MAG: hypothetical protein AVDCRST_MAG19-724, partial [uncultured Thermomicrobiales bacterium]
ALAGVPLWGRALPFRVAFAVGTRRVWDGGGACARDARLSRQRPVDRRHPLRRGRRAGRDRARRARARPRHVLHGYSLGARLRRRACVPRSLLALPL